MEIDFGNKSPEVPCVEDGKDLIDKINAGLLDGAVSFKNNPSFTIVFQRREDKHLVDFSIISAVLSQAELKKQARSIAEEYKLKYEEKNHDANMYLNEAKWDNLVARMSKNAILLNIKYEKIGELARSIFKTYLEAR